MFDNPVHHYYAFWREVIRFHAERHVEEMRANSSTRPAPGITSIEKWSLDHYKWARESAQAPLNYRMSVSATGITDNHLDLAGGLFVPMIEQFEPIITVNVYYYRRRHALMSVWPNGEFMFHNAPAYYMNPFIDATFMRTNYAVGKRVWLLPQEKDHLRNRYSRLDETDFEANRLYVPKHTFATEVKYHLVRKHDQWLFAVDGLCGVDISARKRLEDGYAEAERRYERARRKANRATEEHKREKLVLYVPKHGRMTGFEAVEEFTQHMRVYPAPKPEEAHDGSNHMVASPVLH